MLRCYRSSCNFQHALDATLLQFVLFTPTRSWCYAATVFHVTSNTHLILQTDTLDATLLPFFLQLPTRSWFDAATVLRTKIHTQQFILSQAQFVAVLQKLAMEVHKHSCQLAEKNLEDLETHLLWKSCRMASVTWADEMSWYYGKTRKRPNNR